MLLTYRYALLAVITVAVVMMIAGCGNTPVATVDGVKITETELNQRLVQSFGENVLRSMIDRELLRMAAKEKGIEVTEEELAQEIEKAKSQMGQTPEEIEQNFQQFLAANNLSEEEWKREMEMFLLVQKLERHGIDPTDEELRQYFQEHKEEFARPATVSLSQIVVSSREDAQQVLSELDSGDASFADLANRYSLSTDARTPGGELPPMPIEQIGLPQLKEAAQNVPVGEVSDPIEVNGSWLIIKVRDRTPAREASFEADRDRVLDRYMEEHKHDYEDILKEQIQKANVNIIDPRFQDLNEIYTATPESIPQFGVDGDTAPVPGEGGEGQVVPPAPETPAAPDSQ